MFIGVSRLRTKRTKISNTVGVDVLGDPKMMKFDFVHGYAQILTTEGFHQFYNCKSVRRGAPGTSPPTVFVRCHSITSNSPTNQNLNALVYLDNLILRCYNTDLDSGAGRPKKEAGEKPARARRRMLKIRKADAPTARCDTIGAIREGAARVSTSRKTCHADPP